MSYRVNWYEADKDEPLTIIHHNDEDYGELGYTEQEFDGDELVDIEEEDLEDDFSDDFYDLDDSMDED